MHLPPASHPTRPPHDPTRVALLGDAESITDIVVRKWWVILEDGCNASSRDAVSARREKSACIGHLSSEVAPVLSLFPHLPAHHMQRQSRGLIFI